MPAAADVVAGVGALDRRPALPAGGRRHRRSHLRHRRPHPGGPGVGKGRTHRAAADAGPDGRDPPAGAVAATPAADADKVADQVTDEAETGAASASEKPDASASEPAAEENQ